MKKLLLFTTFVLMSMASIAFAQETMTVEIGNGTVYNEVLPIHNWWQRSYTGNETLYLKEELGIAAASDQLHYVGSFRIQYEKEFHGRMFRDNEVTWVYVYEKSVDISALILQESEVSEVRWFDLDEVWDEIKTDRSRFCVPAGGLNVLREYLKGRDS